ncbi:DNA polymerase-4 [Propionicimonas paludicola]|uniref:DNA polymerase IV n=2 Tax=Propionicimonas paludicola TaxID=185243 RepID=A0A2A9CRE6_9ACTN|nr:DNA polymerase IV [Propionicimonas paludicola]PFG16983.1 DNA polymerase-4 [Propionicimonas paludicola]
MTADEQPTAPILHVDMDAFYAAVAQRDRPELAEVPMWVGGAERGVVLSANYRARAFGVRGGMSVVAARRLCPQGVGVPGDFGSYTEASSEVREILQTFSAKVQMASIDEAYLELPSGPRAVPPAEVGARIRAIIFDELKLTCSVGIGPNRLVAKMAANAAKPDGLREVDADEVIGFLHPLPVEALVGVGESAATKLHRLGVVTIGDLAQLSAVDLRRAFGPHAGLSLRALAWGQSWSAEFHQPGTRGVGCQITGYRDLASVDELHAVLLRVVTKVASRMRAADVLGRRITVGLRYADFTSGSASATLAMPTDVSQELYLAARQVCTRLRGGRLGVRRVGLRVTELSDRSRVAVQPRLDEPDHGWADLDRAGDRLIERFGRGKVQRAVLTRRDGVVGSEIPDRSLDWR